MRVLYYMEKELANFDPSRPGPPSSRVERGEEPWSLKGLQRWGVGYVSLITCPKDACLQILDIVFPSLPWPVRIVWDTAYHPLTDERSLGPCREYEPVVTLLDSRAPGIKS